ncbi:MAG TPA: hypothetical protein VGK58_11995 [Lacipirellulaceae bacterium]
MPQRSPINFWLLLAATICVDAVLMASKYAEAHRHIGSFFVALVFGQLSALCVWASFASRQQFVRAMVPFAFSIAAALWMGLARPRSVPQISFEQLVLAYSGLWLTHAAGLMSLLWALKRTKYGRRWSYPVEAGIWQFSIKHMLVVMTTLAVLIFILRSADLIQEGWLWVVILIANNVGLALGCVLIQGTAWHVVVRLAAIAAVALLFAALPYVIRNWAGVFAENLIHAFVLFLWLEVGGIMPARRPANAVATEGASQ